jgi:hypothetical protein
MKNCGIFLDICGKSGNFLFGNFNVFPFFFVVVGLEARGYRMESMFL